MAPKSTSESNPFRRALAPIEARLHALETSIGGLHPDYMARILNKTTQIEEHCHEQLERIVQVMKHQKTALAEHVSKVSEDLTVFVEDLEDRTAQAIRSMEHATQRHHADAKALRRELGALESVIDTERAAREGAPLLRATAARRAATRVGFGGQSNTTSERTYRH